MTKILIIEDELILAEMYRDKFTQAGYEVVLAFSAEEGLKLVKDKKEKPDLILLDILLPRENGIQFLKRFKKIAGVAQVPIVAFSNYDEPKTRKEAEELGVKDYLIKTEFTPNEIVEKVKTYL